MAGRPKGHPKTGGRERGTPNKLSADVRALILAALDAVGGQAYLAEQAQRNPVAFLTLLGKVLPLKVAGDQSAPLMIVTGVMRHGEG